MNNRVIGRIISINHNNVTAELTQNLGSYITLYDGIRFVGEIGSYVAIDDLNRRIIAEIISVDEKNEMAAEKLNKAESRRYLKINLLGEISNSIFNFGVTKMPPVFSEIKIISESDLRLMLDINENDITDDSGKTKLTVLPIGSSVMFPEYQVKVKLNEFFGFHFAVFGNTGSGKSNTIANIIQRIFSKKDYSARGAKFIVFDSNGEYEAAFKSVNKINSQINARFLSTSYDAENRLISSLDDTATEVVTKVFCKMLFDYMRSLKPRNAMPVNLILEEAHRFVRSDMDYGVLGYNIFERIAKEGRKFGLLMGISSQRPSELSKTVVSQCSNFIIHKIQNPDDIQYISRMVPYVNQGIVDRITYLRRGHALVFGTAINLPTLTAFDKANPTPNSGNSNIVEKWYL